MISLYILGKKAAETVTWCENQSISQGLWRSAPYRKANVVNQSKRVAFTSSEE